MSVCRRCGILTDSPLGLNHAPHPSQVGRASEWLVAQSRLRQIDRAKEMRAK
jgi:hypothetical protein